MFVPKLIKDVINKLNNEGYEAYLVGGAVRDAIMEYPVSDYDLTTNASLDDLRLLFSDYKLKTYSSKRTIAIIDDSKYFVEVTPYKGNSLIEDLSNRDFTINAIAYDLSNFIDPFGGINDIKRKLIKTTIDPIITIENDITRIIRAIKFEAKYDMKIDDSLKEVMKTKASLLKDINKERIRDNLNSILLSIKPSIYFNEHKEVFFSLFPPLEKCYKFDQKSRWHHLDVFDHIMSVVDTTKQDLILRLAALYHDIMKPECFTFDNRGGHFYGHEKLSTAYARKSMDEFRYSSFDIERVCNIVYYHDMDIMDTDESVLNFIYKFGVENMDLLFGIKRADIISQNPNLLDRIYIIDKIASRCKKIIDDKKYINMKTIKITGDELITLGAQANQIKTILNDMINNVISGKMKNEHKELLSYAQKLLKRGINE